jgi:hypothetical protein
MLRHAILWVRGISRWMPESGPADLDLASLILDRSIGSTAHLTQFNAASVRLREALSEHQRRITCLTQSGEAP